MLPTSAKTEKAWLAERAIGLLKHITFAQIKHANAPLNEWHTSLDHATFLLDQQRTVHLPQGVTRQLAWDLNADYSRITPEIIAKLPWELDPAHTIPIWGSAGWSKLHAQPKGQDQWEVVIYNGRKINFPKMHVVRSVATRRQYYTKNFLPENGILPWKDQKFDHELAPLLPSAGAIDTPPIDKSNSLAEFKSSQFSPDEKDELKLLSLTDDVSGPPVSEGKMSTSKPLLEPESMIYEDCRTTYRHSNSTARA